MKTTRKVAVAIDSYDWRDNLQDILSTYWMPSELLSGERRIPRDAVKEKWGGFRAVPSKENSFTTPSFVDYGYRRSKAGIGLGDHCGNKPGGY